MTKRLTESVKLIEKAYRRKMKKQKWEKTIPSFRNFEVDYDEGQYFEQLRIVVTNILNVEEHAKYSKIHSLRGTGSTFIIESIICPTCRNPVFLNYHWNCFICNCEEHEKKIYEICKVVVNNGIPKETIGKEMV